MTYSTLRNLALIATQIQLMIFYPFYCNINIIIIVIIIVSRINIVTQNDNAKLLSHNRYEKITTNGKTQQ